MRFSDILMVAAQAGGAAPTIYYVDSVNGSDANDGLTLATAKQTIAAGQALMAAGKTLALARGSYWREQFTFTFNSESIVVVGSGAMPVMDGADIVTTGWTQPDSVTYPNVWSRSWTRSIPPGTGSAYLGYWQAGVRTTRQTSLANLQAGSNGDWHTTSLTLQTATVSIKSAADPNSDGILREIGKRGYGIVGHPTNIGSTLTGQSVTGPIELKRAIEHYNALSLGPGSSSLAFLRDGNVHHATSISDLTDMIATEYHPDISPNGFTFYNPVSAGFTPVGTRLGVLWPGGDSRVSGAQGFYCHGGSGSIDSLTLNGCWVKGADFMNSDAQVATCNGGYCEDFYTKGVNFGSNNNVISYLFIHETLLNPFNSSNSGFFTAGIASANDNGAVVSHCAVRTLRGVGVRLNSGNAGTYSYDNCSFYVAAGAVEISSATTTPSFHKCIFQSSGRSMNGLLSTGGYVGDYNVFYWTGTSAPQFGYNSATYTSLATWQAATGQDANSVFLKSTDQVSGNGIAFWLGLANGTNTGPPDGDWRVNPSAKVYKGDGTALTGLFADGTTAITLAGPQNYWNFNNRSLSAGPPIKRPTLPASVAEMRTYLEAPASWNFYP